MKAILMSLLMLVSFSAQAVEELTSKELETRIAGEKLPIIVDIFAEWCGPCKQLAPMLEKAEKKFAGKVKIYKVNGDSDKNKELKGAVRAFPTIMVMKVKGDKVAVAIREGGFRSQEELEAFIQEVIKNK